MLDTINRVLEDFGASPLLSLLLLFAVLWILFNYFALIRGTPEESSFQRSKTWLQQDTFATLYRQLLGDFFLKPLAHWVGDHAHFSATNNTTSTENASRWMLRWFGLNPFTVASYEKVLILAFFYPMISLFLTWWWTGSGYIGDYNYLPSEGMDRMLRGWILLGFFLLTLSLITIFKRLRGISQIVALGVILLIIIGIIYSNEGDILAYLMVLPVIFFIIFIPIYCSGGLLAWLLWKNRTKAQQLIYPFAVAFAGAFAFAIAGAIAVVVAVAVAFAGAFAVAGVFAGAVAVAGAFAIAGAVAGAGVFAGVFAVAFAFAGAGAVAFAGAGAVAVAGAGAFVSAFVGAIFILADFYYKKSQDQQLLSRFWYVYIGLIIAASLGLINYNVDAETLSLLLIFTLFPLLNAGLDWLSWGVTRGLLTAIYQGRHRSRHALLWASLDIVLALGFLILMSLSMIALVGLANLLAGGTEPLMDLNHTFVSLRQGEYAQHFWIFFMLLSTLIPTLVHFAIAGGAAAILWLPKQWRHWLADDMENDKHKVYLAFLYLSFTPLLGFFIVPALMLWGLWSLLHAMVEGYSIGAWLLSAAEAWYGLF